MNTKTGEIVSVPEDRGLTGLDEDEKLWEEIEEAGHFIRLQEQYELQEKRIMEDFTNTCVSAGTANRLWRALNGRHPHRYFKDAINETAVARKYYDFRALTFLRMVKKWCREHKVRYWKNHELSALGGRSCISKYNIHSIKKDVILIQLLDRSRRGNASFTITGYEN